MPGAPRFTQKPSIQQTPQGDLLMECYLEADPPPDIIWNHAGAPIIAGPRVEITLTNLQSSLYKAILIIKEPNVGDGGAYKCTASNQFGESNANINLNFAGAGDEQKGAARGPTFLSKPRIIPKDGGALIVMECRVKSASKPHGVWYKNGVPIHENALYSIFFSNLGESSYLFQLELHNPVAEDAGQYRCNIKNDLGETNANLTLNFEQEPAEQHEKTEKNRSASPRPASRQDSRPGSPKKQLKSREGTPRKSIQSKTGTPTRETEANASTTTDISEVKTEQMEVDSISAKEKSVPALPPKEKKLRQSPLPKSKLSRGETFETATEKARTDSISIAAAANKTSETLAVRTREERKISKDNSVKEELTNKTTKSATTTKAKETKTNQMTKRAVGATDKSPEAESESKLEKSIASIAPSENKHSAKSREPVKKEKKEDQKSKSSKFPDLKSELEVRGAMF